MACCIIAAYLYALARDRVRHAGMIWGLVRVPPGEAVETVYARLARRLRLAR